MIEIRAKQLDRLYQEQHEHKLEKQQAEQVYLLQVQQANMLVVACGRVARNIQLDRDKGRILDIRC